MKNLCTLVVVLTITVALVGMGVVQQSRSAVGAEQDTQSADQTPDQTSDQAPDQAAIKRARDMVQMLDNIYKQTVVLITDKYVHDEDDYPAGSAAVRLFANISKSGSHQVRLIDATGQPYVEANVAKDAFEREAVKRLKAGAETHEQIVYKDGRHHLRVVTPVPVVMEKCVMCHDHYADAKEGEPIGAISYTVPIE